MDLGLWFVPTAYSLRHARGYGRSALRTWQFQVSKDGVNWETLREHSDDQSLNEPGSTATWKIEYDNKKKHESDENEEEEEPSPSTTAKEGGGLGWRHVRIQQVGGILRTLA